MTVTITLRYKMCNVEFGGHGFNVIDHIKKNTAIAGIFEVDISDFITSSFSAAIHVADVEIPRALETTLIRAFFPKHFSISTPKVLLKMFC